MVWVMETKALTSCPRVKMGRRYSAPLMKLTDSTTRIIQQSNVVGSVGIGSWSNLRLLLGEKL